MLPLYPLPAASPHLDELMRCHVLRSTNSTCSGVEHIISRAAIKHEPTTWHEKGMPLQSVGKPSHLHSAYIVLSSKKRQLPPPFLSKCHTSWWLFRDAKISAKLPRPGRLTTGSPETTGPLKKRTLIFQTKTIYLSGVPVIQIFRAFFVGRKLFPNDSAKRQGAFLMTEHRMEQEKISIRQRWGVQHAMQNIVALGMIPWSGKTRQQTRAT